jgi:hypothetical protein
MVDCFHHSKAEPVLIAAEAVWTEFRTATAQQADYRKPDLVVHSARHYSVQSVQRDHAADSWVTAAAKTAVA